MRKDVVVLAATIALLAGSAPAYAGHVHGIQTADSPSTGRPIEGGGSWIVNKNNGYYLGRAMVGSSFDDEYTDGGNWHYGRAVTTVDMCGWVMPGSMGAGRGDVADSCSTATRERISHRRAFGRDFNARAHEAVTGTAAPADPHNPNNNNKNNKTNTTKTNTKTPNKQPLYNYIKSHHAGTQVCINPGAIPDGPNWMTACDIVMDFETNYSSYKGVFSPSWVFNYPPTRFWNAIINTPTSAADVDACFATAAQNNAGYIFITNLNGSQNTYGSLPNSTIWNEEVADATAPGTLPGTPGSLAATAGNTQVSLTWSAASGATSYNVYRGTTAGGEGSTPISTGITGTSYVNTGLTNGTTYYYKVAAVNSGGTGSMSSEVNSTPTSQVGVPAAPTGVVATVGNQQVGISWSTVINATSYNVYRGTSAGGESATPIATGITATFFTNTGLSNNTRYYYKVAAVDGAGTGSKSAEVNARPTSSSGSITNESETISGSNVTFKFNFTGSWVYFHVYLDTDRNPSTGYTIGGSGGDDLIENGGLYGYAGGSGTAWSWSSAGSVTYTNSGGLATFTFPLASIGSPSHMNAVYEVVNSSGTSYSTTPFGY